jgi:hypothetical protein
MEETILPFIKGTVAPMHESHAEAASFFIGWLYAVPIRCY